jgi:UPF0755 protein
VSGRRWRLVAKVIVGVVALALVTAAVAFMTVRAKLAQPVVSGDTPVTLVVAPGMSFRDVARTLAAGGGFAEHRLLTWYARWRDVAGQVQAGEYLVAPGTSVDAFLKQLVDGDVVLHSLTVVEGWTFAQFLAALRGHPDVRQTLTGMDEAAVMAALGYAGEHPEGRFFPETYSFARGTSDRKILQQAYGAMRKRLDAAWAARSETCPLTSAYEALILASIIEKETGRADERRQIAGVFCRRLAKGMRLQTDPTVIYGLGKGFNGNITRRDLRTDTPYNTYTRSGLPPTPIALPGAGSLAAAVNPQSGDSLFFVATGDGDGGHYFSRTLAEHEQAVARYLAKIRAPK